MHKLISIIALLLMFTAGAPALAVPIPTVTSLSSSDFAADPGQSITFTSTVSAAGNPVTTGAVNWSYRAGVLDPNSGVTSFSGAYSGLGSFALNALGQTQTTVTTLPIGLFDIRAVYDGNENYLGSSGTMIQRVLAPPPPPPPSRSTLINMSTPQFTSVAGDSVTFDARVFFEGLALTGTLDFSVFLNNVIVESSSSAIDAGGFASFTSNTLPVGVLFVTSGYAGDATHNSSSGVIIHTVTAAAQVPEPGTLALLGLGLAGVGLLRRREKKGG